MYLTGSMTAPLIFFLSMATSKMGSSTVKWTTTFGSKAGGQSYKTFFFFVTDDVGKKAKAFARANQFKPSLMFVSEAGTYLSGSDLTRKYWTNLDRIARNKCSSLYERSASHW